MYVTHTNSVYSENITLLNHIPYPQYVHQIADGGGISVNQGLIYDPDKLFAGLQGYFSPLHRDNRGFFADVNESGVGPLGLTTDKVPFAHWTHSTHCRSHDRCLAFTSQDKFEYEGIGLGWNMVNNGTNSGAWQNDQEWLPYSTQNQYQAPPTTMAQGGIVGTSPLLFKNQGGMVNDGGIKSFKKYGY